MVDGSVSAQDNRGVGGGHRFSALVADDLAPGPGEQGQVLGRYVRAEDGDGAHAEGFNHREHGEGRRNWFRVGLL